MKTATTASTTTLMLITILTATLTAARADAQTEADVLVEDAQAEDVLVEDAQAEDVAAEADVGLLIREGALNPPTHLDAASAREEDEESDGQEEYDPLLPAPTHSLGVIGATEDEEPTDRRDPNRRLRNAGLILMLSSYGASFMQGMMSMMFMGPMSMMSMIPLAGSASTATMFGFDPELMPMTMMGLLSSVGQLTGLIMTCVGAGRMRRARRERASRLRNIAVAPTGPTGGTGLTLSGQF